MIDVWTSRRHKRDREGSIESMPLSPGIVRDSIVDFLGAIGGDAAIEEILLAVQSRVGFVSPSSVRSYLNLNTPTTFERTGRGRYRLNFNGHFELLTHGKRQAIAPPSEAGLAKLYHADSFEWLAAQDSRTVHAVVTDPPYGLVEFSAKETAKLRSGNRGGIWRIPPSFDGHQRAPLPRFTVLDEEDRAELHRFFLKLGRLILRVAVPGANVIVASNSLLAHIVANAMAQSGLELRGYISRQVMTMRGGDRPKNAHEEFSEVSVMPRSQWEPWVVLRAPIEGRVQDNLRKWGTGGFRRPSAERPFGDVIKSSPTPAAERKIAPHPSLKPQALMRQLVRASLPLGEGVVLDPFMGAGSTLAAANAVDYDSIGIEMDRHFFDLAGKAIPKLAVLNIREPSSPS